MSVLGACLASVFHFMVTNFSNAEVGSPMDWYNHPSSLVECLLGNFIHSMYHTTICLVIKLNLIFSMIALGRALIVHFKMPLARNLSFGSSGSQAFFLG